MEQNIKHYGGVAAAALAIVSSPLQSLLSAAPTASLLAEKRRHLRSLLPLLLRFLLRLVIVILSPLLALLASLPPSRFPTSTSPASPAAARALEHVLALLSRVPVASRKYDLLRSLADRLLDDNLSFSCELEALNRVALSNAFSLTLRRLEVAVAAAAGSGARDGSLDLIVGAVKSGLRRLSTTEEAVAPEKLAAELLWMAGKMEACGAAEEAVARWGEAAELGRLALSAEPRLQAALVKLSGKMVDDGKTFLKGSISSQEDIGCCKDTCTQSSRRKNARNRINKLRRQRYRRPILIGLPTQKVGRPKQFS